MDFLTAFAHLVDVEKGLSLDPVDSGNWTGGRQGAGELRGTKYGVSAAAYPREDIANLTLERAQMIYLVDYWSEVACDALPGAVRYEMFDMAVNSGPAAAREALQAAAGVAVDGKVGPVTLAAVRAMDPLDLERRFDGQRLLHVAQLDPVRWQRFGRGLVIRIANTMLAAA